jgi:hypothetical protein
MEGHMRRWCVVLVVLAAGAAAVMAASKTTSQLGTSPNTPLSASEFQYEVRTRFNQAVNDIDTLMAKASGTSTADSITATKVTATTVVTDTLTVGGAIVADTLNGDLVATGSLTADSMAVGALYITTIDTVGSNDTLLIILSTGDSLIIATDR